MSSIISNNRIKRENRSQITLRMNNAEIKRLYLDHCFGVFLERESEKDYTRKQNRTVVRHKETRKSSHIRTRLLKFLLLSVDLVFTLSHQHHTSPKRNLSLRFQSKSFVTFQASKLLRFRD